MFVLESLTKTIPGHQIITGAINAVLRIRITVGLPLITGAINAVLRIRITVVCR